MLTFSIPVAVFYVVGGIAAIVILGFAVIGVAFVWAFKDGIGWH